MRKFNFLASRPNRRPAGLRVALTLLTLLLMINGHAQYLGTKTPYQPSGLHHTPAPAGYKPVFVNYVGRHGARFLTKAGADMTVLQALQEAEKASGLTAAGKKILAMTVRLRNAGKGNYENITSLGRSEQQAIGERMLAAYKPVFTGKGLEIRTTWKVRTQQSADAFLQAFSGYGGKKSFVRMPDSLDAGLRFYDLSPAYARYKKSPALSKALDSLEQDERTAAVAKRVSKRVFQPGYRPANERAFMENLYDLYTISFSMQKESGAAGGEEIMGLAFDPKDLAWLDCMNGAADFLEKGPGHDPEGIQVKVAVPLLVDFINSLDTVTGTGGPAKKDAILRFTHAEAISPFATLLGIGGASTPAPSVFQYHSGWQAEKVIPLSANIQWILYAGPGADYLVKILLNEKEAVLPLATKTWPYYPWKDLRLYYIGKLRSLHAGLQDDMHRYLAELE